MDEGHVGALRSRRMGLKQRLALVAVASGCCFIKELKMNIID